MTSSWNDRELPTTICLFDVDGTLTPARGVITDSMRQTLADLRKKCVVGFVGGSDFAKQKEQLGEDAVSMFDFCFSENGLTAFRSGAPLPGNSFLEFMGEARYAKLVNFCLRYIADLELPQKRGTFIEFRQGMVNISPVGRDCSREERNAYEKFDLENKIREKFVEALKREFPDYGLKYSIGGQISFDVFPIGWDKTFCLRHLEGEGFDTIHFFGDKTFEGGNDWEIYHHEAITGHAVKNPLETEAILKDLFHI
ncbi:Phosphomannomutase 1 [Coemansia sp. RSA 2523]|nr:Phosphomannomutase 1 [Coemansia sp. RSA 1591]KAJ1754547.1 Phosphomannomutase 1 [Coemansia sp. RSA 1752]KAJ1779347.1 Phosphomannomutase 1 [Coemansia sp. RSA 1824]KAJ1781917.1 Phosphomannomutase 1 [Coemansia sp. RSA 1938]KAJ1789047.1 Phosphomannomutase 1 [Coemansia sp. RSA 2167]KAJ1810891.1 Phosphomannomutase 1 [Coemansia sp. RSA 2523]KAJ2148853.1 Phosphomannomutase 1 [Coemansia sp. RSA 564]KAJ2155621.1 Phosphomannomutase 1 [Coemansia sp. RSA 637]KAJ2170013.1 Phosphomannomutase 1 [Coemansi